MNFGVLHEGDFPSDLAPQFAEITKATTKIPPVAKEGSYTATISKMSDEEARKIIEKILCSTRTWRSAVTRTSMRTTGQRSFFLREQVAISDTASLSQRWLLQRVSRVTSPPKLP
ncbi:MAG: hypothetical protein DMG25_04790 [Acidobacteria bacterium]|nr:MAG: hypothetical protein DMG25_04790 [Acidobacteriota bacterium]